MNDNPSIDMIHYLDQHFATQDWLTQDVWFQVRKRLKNQDGTSDKDVFEKIIAITTMDSLPELCYECPLHDGENGQCNADKEKRYSAEYRPYWCPLKDINLNNTGGEAETSDREKVIHGLEVQLDDLQKYADNDQPLTLTQEQAQEIISLLKEQKANGAWEFVCHNPSYSPFDNSPSSLYRCTNCRYTTGSTTKYCPMCGSRNQP